jgi:hypothetical protein
MCETREMHCALAQVALNSEEPEIVQQGVQDLAETVLEQHGAVESFGAAMLIAACTVAELCLQVTMEGHAGVRAH